MEVLRMKMTKAASKCAAVLCAMAVMMPAAAAVVPATVFNGGAIVASAATPTYNFTSMTGDMYVKNGDSFAFTVNVGSWVKNASYQWEIAYAGTNFNWQTFSGATSATIKGTMTDKLNGAHVRCKITNTDSGVVDYSTVRTLSNIAVKAAMGTAVKQSDGSYKIPVTITGAYKNMVSTFMPNFKFDANLVSAIKWEYSSNLVNEGDGFGFGFFQENDPKDTDGDGKTDRVDKVAGSYVLQHATVMTPTVLGSDNVLGYLYVTPKSGATAVKVNMTAYNDNPMVLTGSNVEGDMVYGATYTGTTINVSSSTTSTTVPQNLKVEYSEQYHQMRFTWDKVSGADKYGIAVYLAGKWRIQTSNITTNSYTSPKNMTPGMSYKVAVAARVNGQWDTAGAIKNAITVTVK
jgi:hypothetical protein